MKKFLLVLLFCFSNAFAMGCGFQTVNVYDVFREQYVGRYVLKYCSKKTNWRAQSELMCKADKRGEKYGSLTCIPPRDINSASWLFRYNESPSVCMWKKSRQALICMLNEE